MARLTEDNVRIAQEIISRYPRSRSATIPLLHLAQEQDGYVTEEAMAHIGELVGASSAEVYGTASFYEMFKFHPVGKYVINICGTMSCALLGADELLHHAEHKLGIKAGGTTPDGMFTIEHAECQAACTEAPCLQVNYRYRFRVTGGKERVYSVPEGYAYTRRPRNTRWQGDPVAFAALGAVVQALPVHPHEAI